MRGYRQFGGEWVNRQSVSLKIDFFFFRTWKRCISRSQEEFHEV